MYRKSVDRYLYIFPSIIVQCPFFLHYLILKFSIPVQRTEHSLAQVYYLEGDFLKAFHYLLRNAGNV